jgi:hypothetical protein
MMKPQHSILSRRPPVAEIRSFPPQSAVIGREPFEAIADLVLYEDASRPLRVPALTWRKLLEPNGPRHPTTEVKFPAGLTERLSALLTARGWQVTVAGPPPVEPPPHGLGAPTALLKADGRPHALVLLPQFYQRLRFVAALRESYPDSHLLVVVKNKRQARSLARKLRRATGQPVTWGIEPRMEFPWTHVDSVGTFTGRSVQDWAFVVFWDAELVLSWTSLMQLGHMFGSRRIGFITRDERQLNEADRALIEGMFGPVVYRPGDEHADFTTVSVAWLPAASYPAGGPETQLERKRIFFWHNPMRNRLIAAAAQAFSESDMRAIARLGLDAAARWLAGEELGQVPIFSSRAPTVAIVVENPEHARELAQLLPGWSLESQNGSMDPDPTVIDNTIVTLPLAAKSTLATDVVIYAAGCGEEWFDKLGLACAGITGERMLLVDMADDCDERAARDIQARQADYHRRGWAMEELCERTRK